MPLYEVAILETPTKKESEETGELERLVFGPKAIVAQDPQSAGIAAVLTENVKVRKERMKVLVRPFV